MIEISSPCGVPAHRMGRWEDVVLGIWWCPDCCEEIWATEGVDGDGEAVGVGSSQAGPEGGRGVDAAALPDVRADEAHGGDAAGAPRDRSPGGAGWRDQQGGSLLWHLILEAFGRAAS